MSILNINRNQFQNFPSPLVKTTVLTKINSILLCNTFHSCSILMVDKQGKGDKSILEQLGPLDFSKSDEICLTELEAAKLRKGLEDLKNLNKLDSLPSEPDTLTSEGLSSIKESLPNLESSFFNDLKNKDSLVKTFEKLRAKDYLKDNTETEELRNQIQENETKITDLTQEVASLLSDMNNILDVSAKLDKGLENVTRTFEFISKNQYNIELTLSTISFISLILAYRGLLTTYSKVLFSKASENLNHTEYLNALKLRRAMIHKFNLVAVPSLVGYYLYMQQYHKIFNPIAENFTGSSTATSINMLFKQNENKDQNKYKFKRLVVFCVTALLSLIIIYLILNIINYFSSNTYGYILSLFSNSSLANWIKYSLLFWYIGWLLHYILEFYLFINYSKNSNHNATSLWGKNLPKFILNWINRVKSQAKLPSSAFAWFVQVYIRVILFHSCLLLIFIYFIV